MMYESIVCPYGPNPKDRGLRPLGHWVAATGSASGESTSGADSPWMPVGVSMSSWGYPKVAIDGLCHGKAYENSDDDWG